MCGSSAVHYQPYVVRFDSGRHNEQPELKTLIILGHAGQNPSQGLFEIININYMHFSFAILDIAKNKANFET